MSALQALCQPGRLHLNYPTDLSDHVGITPDTKEHNDLAEIEQGLSL